MLDAEEVCPALPPGTELLRGQYRIDKRIGQGGFGLTYVARDSLNRTVVIKECFPSQICMREGPLVRPRDAECAHYFDAILGQFQSEAHRLASLDHPGIVGVHQTFAENGTAYTAMDFVEGVDLMALVEQAPGRLTASTIDGILRQVLDALRYLHDRGILHRDVAPDNLILGEDGRITLIDFGAAYSSDDAETGECQRMLAVKDGYSPPEFYTADGHQGAHSDIYAFGALCHLIFTGEAPPDAEHREEMVSAQQADPYQPLEAAKLDLDIRLCLATDRALTLDPSERLKSADDWIALMDGPVPKPMPVFDPSVIAAIEDLVLSTNRGVIPGLPKVLQPAAVELDARAAPPPPRQYVDIFGDPIDDVEAYLKEQDRLCRQRAAKARPVLIHGEVKPAANASHPQHASTVFGAFFKRVRGRKSADNRPPETRSFQTRRTIT